MLPKDKKTPIEMGESGSMFPKIATILLTIAFLLHLIAIGSNWWARSDMNRTERNEHMGLWRYCANPVNGVGGEACDDFVNIIYGGSCLIVSLYVQA